MGLLPAAERRRENLQEKRGSGFAPVLEWGSDAPRAFDGEDKPMSPDWSFLRD